MTDVWVVNASPIIVLAKTGQLDLLANLAGEIVVPAAVAAEVLAGPVGDPGRRAIEAGWGNRVTAAAIPAVLQEWGLGAGETAVLAVALQKPGSRAVLDDAAARMCARALRVAVVGTLGVIVRARKRGLIESAASAIRALCNAGLHVDDETIQTALRDVGETWEP